MNSTPGGGIACACVLTVAGLCRGQTACGSWTVLTGPESGGPQTQEARIRAMRYWDDGTGESLYATGTFRGASASILSIAKFNGATWQALGAGIGGDGSALQPFDDGTGPALYVAGSFLGAGLVPNTNGIARWRGQSWSAVGTGLDNGAINALAVYDDGAGPALYAGGGFSGIGGVAAPGLALGGADNGTRWPPARTERYGR